MTIEQKRKILKKIKTLECDIEKLEGVEMVIAANGYASCTLASSGGGSKSYTVADVAKVSALIATLKKRLKAYHKMFVNNGNNNGLPNFVTVIY